VMEYRSIGSNPLLQHSIAFTQLNMNFSAPIFTPILKLVIGVYFNNYLI